jgi:Family of unknown function (DUF6511)
MSNVFSRFATKRPTVCAVCRRRAVWLGCTPAPHARPILFLCDDSGCHRAGKGLFKMPSAILDAYEIGSALEAGAEAGRYLDEIEKTDLAVLSGDEWREFLRRIIVGFEQTMRRKILENECPF